MNLEIKTHVLELQNLQNNASKLSPERIVKVFCPEENPSCVLYVLSPWTHAGRIALDWQPFKESLPERLVRLKNEGKIAHIPCLVAPDFYTEYGGSQFIDGPYFGNQAKALVEEIFPFIEKHYPIPQGWQKRGIFGRSSGGYGALRLCMDYPQAVSACAAHSADLGFEWLFLPDMLTLPDKLRKYDGRIEKFMSYVESAKKLERGDIHLLMLLGCCGFYSPNPAGHFDLPIDLYNGELIESVWQKWLEHDVVHRFDSRKNSLGLLKHLYIEVGLFDQYRLLYGARRLHQKLATANIEHIYEEFPDNHSGTDYRYDMSLPAMIQALTD
jgi:hypothetical protein